MANQTVRKSLSSLQSVKTGKGEKSGLQTLVDIVLVMDATLSMQNLMDAVKENALQLHAKIKAALAEKNRMAEKIRVKVILFRDVYVDEVPFQESEFFILQENGQGDELQFRSYIADIRAEGGGDLPENSLEALHMAMNVDFAQPLQGQKARHIIVLMTDAEAHKLEDPRRAAAVRTNSYPAGVPNDLISLQAEWEEKMDRDARRMVIFAPNSYPWNSVGSWMDVEFVPSPAGVGIDSRRFDDVLRAIAGSLR